MPMVYGVAPATSLTTSGTANTEVDALFIAAGVRNVALDSAQVVGKGAAQTSISGIAFRLKHMSTASTAGTAITPKPRDPGFQAAKATAAHTPTAGTVAGSLHWALGCGRAGPGGWAATHPDDRPTIEGGSGDSLDVFSVSADTSLPFELSVGFVE